MLDKKYSVPFVVNIIPKEQEKITFIWEKGSVGSKGGDLS